MISASTFLFVSSVRSILVHNLNTACQYFRRTQLLAEKMKQNEKQRYARWYFGGLGSAGASCVTHPLDLLKVSPTNCISFILDKKNQQKKPTKTNSMFSPL